MPLLIMSLQSCYGSILSPLRKLQRLSLGVSLYGAYGSREEGDSEPEMEGCQELGAEACERGVKGEVLRYSSIRLL